MNCLEKSKENFKIYWNNLSLLMWVHDYVVEASVKECFKDKLILNIGDTDLELTNVEYVETPKTPLKKDQTVELHYLSHRFLKGKKKIIVDDLSLRSLSPEELSKIFKDLGI